MKINDFIKRARDDMNRFRANYERTSNQHIGLLDEERTYKDWLGLLALYVEQDSSPDPLADARRKP